MKRHCIDEETILDFLEGRLAQRIRKRVETHLCSCADCRERLSLAAALAPGDPVDALDAAPVVVTQRAVDAVDAISENKPGWRRRLAGWGDRLFSRGGAGTEKWPFGSDLQPAALRGGPGTELGLLIRDQIDGPGFTAVIEVEKVNDTHFTIQISPDPDEIIDTALRVGLFAGDREMASATFWDEPVQFEQIPNGEYTLAFFQSSQQLANYAFTVNTEFMAEH